MPIANMVVAVDVAMGVVVTQSPLPVEAPFWKPGFARAPVVGRRRRKIGPGLSACRNRQTCGSQHRRSYDDPFRTHAELNSHHDPAVTRPPLQMPVIGAYANFGTCW
jgi:hypothetical protein